MRVDHRGNAVVVELRLAPGDALGDHHALFHGLVRKHRAIYYVSNGINMVNIGFQVAINFDFTFFVC